MDRGTAQPIVIQFATGSCVVIVCVDAHDRARTRFPIRRRGWRGGGLRSRACRGQDDGANEDASEWRHVRLREQPHAMWLRTTGCGTLGRWVAVVSPTPLLLTSSPPRHRSSLAAMAAGRSVRSASLCEVLFGMCCSAIVCFSGCGCAHIRLSSSSTIVRKISFSFVVSGAAHFRPSVRDRRGVRCLADRTGRDAGPFAPIIARELCA